MNNENSTNLQKMKAKIAIREVAQQTPLSRGVIAAHEQMKIFRQVSSSEAEPCVPQIRGNIAAHEQVKILRQAMTMNNTKQETPLTRGIIAAHEQIRILHSLGQEYLA